jgi:hypothetical protein
MMALPRGELRKAGRDQSLLLRELCCIGEQIDEIWRMHRVGGWSEDPAEVRPEPDRFVLDKSMAWTSRLNGVAGIDLLEGQLHLPGLDLR